MEFSLFGKLLIIYLICKTVSCNFTILFITFVNQYSPHYVTPDFDSLQLPPAPAACIFCQQSSDPGSKFRSLQSIHIHCSVGGDVRNGAVWRT